MIFFSFCVGYLIGSSPFCAFVQRFCGADVHCTTLAHDISEVKLSTTILWSWYSVCTQQFCGADVRCTLSFAIQNWARPELRFAVRIISLMFNIKKGLRQLALIQPNTTLRGWRRTSCIDLVDWTTDCNTAKIISERGKQTIFFFLLRDGLSSFILHFLPLSHIPPSSFDSTLCSFLTKYYPTFSQLYLSLHYYFSLFLFS